ncbi:MAG: methylated-DNA--[protein]-cysteine S-methyltransferase [Bacteroidota bacterium]
MNDYQKIEKAIEFIQANLKAQPVLDEVAEAIHLSPFHFQRLFTKWAGVSPKKFLQYLSLNYAKDLLKEGNSPLSEVAYEVGLSGGSRLHDLFVTMEAMTPGEYKNQGEQLVIRYSFHTSHFGDFILASTPKGICHLSFVENPELGLSLLRQEWPKAQFIHLPETNEPFAKAIFNGEKSLSPIPLNLKGTPFQLKVWDALLRIPEGQLSSYSQMAECIGEPTASRAVGTAIGSNPIAYLIPCHRVIRKVGGLGGYRWGITRKVAMIGWEAARLEQETEKLA